MFHDDIEQLVAQTFEEAALYSKDSRDFLYTDHEENRAEDDSDLKRPDEVPGVLYHLQKNDSTFVVRMVVSSNLKAERERILSAPEDYPSLRLLSEDGPERPEERLEFFECDNLQLAKAVKAQLANKRFPLHEERIINVSDPGDNWWIKKDEKGLSIYSKLCRTESIERLVKAGPLGDCQGSSNFLNKLYGYFSLLFPVKDFSSAHGQFFLSSTEPFHPVFEDVANVFIGGEMGNALWERLRRLESETESPQVLDSLRRANYFLMEIATVRSFWIEIQKKLS